MQKVEKKETVFLGRKDMQKSEQRTRWDFVTPFCVFVIPFSVLVVHVRKNENMGPCLW